jgi:hypothetical protein
MLEHHYWLGFHDMSGTLDKIKICSTYKRTTTESHPSAGRVQMMTILAAVAKKYDMTDQPSSFSASKHDYNVPKAILPDCSDGNRRFVGIRMEVDNPICR